MAPSGPASSSAPSASLEAPLALEAGAGGFGLALVSAGNFANIGGASESLVAAFGSNLAGAAGATTVNVKDNTGIERAGRVLFASSGQVNFMLPAGLANGPATVTVLYAGNPVGTTGYQIETVAPAMFTANGSGLGVPRFSGQCLENSSKAGPNEAR